jgi:two-component system, OmpR family, sensor histidine kinase MtrB
VTKAFVRLPARWSGRRLLGSRRLGLRARITMAFGIGALLLSTLLSATTWALTRENLLNQREAASTTVVYQNADRVRRNLTTDPTWTQIDVLATPSGSRPLLYSRGEFTAQTAEFGRDALLPGFRDMVLDGQPARMQYRLRGEMQLAIGVPLPSVEAAYFEIVSLADLERTLRALAVSLTGASLVTTLAGGALGWWASRRALRPLTGVSTAATALAGGRLDTRLEASDDPDLAPIATSFNDMAQALQDRIERDARFASDVSHELRSPLMTLAASIEVIENQREELPERARAALDLMVADIDRFQQLVEDLLEISRFDVGAIKLHLEEVVAVEMVIQAVSVLGGGGVPVRYDPEVSDVIVRVDKRRFGRVIANLLDNANKYAGGATATTLSVVGHHLQIAVEDRGSGVPPEDRTAIFDRFARGGESGKRSTDSGVGLGLSLVDEHVRLHGGRVWVEDRLDGEPGARFVVELPIVEPPTAEEPDEGAEP